VKFSATEISDFSKSSRIVLIYYNTLPTSNTNTLLICVSAYSRGIVHTLFNCEERFVGL